MGRKTFTQSFGLGKSFMEEACARTTVKKDLLTIVLSNVSSRSIAMVMLAVFLKVDFLPIVVLVFVLSHNWLAISRGIFPVKILLCLFAQNFGDFQG